MLIYIREFWMPNNLKLTGPVGAGNFSFQKKGNSKDEKKRNQEKKVLDRCAL